MEEHVTKAKSNCFAPQVISDQTFEDVPEAADCPNEVQHIWRWYVELDASRSEGMDIGPILYTEIEAWARLCKIDLTRFEVIAMRQVDKAYMKFHRANKKAKPNV